MMKKLAKASKGKIVDPEGNKITTRENKRTGKVVTKIKYADPASAGMKREKIVTPGMTKMERKTNLMYKKNPNWAAEDDYNVKKKGGPAKVLRKAQTGTVASGTVMSDGRTYTDRRYKPAAQVKSNTVPVGTKMSDGRTWDGKNYVKKGGVIKSKKKK